MTGLVVCRLCGLSRHPEHATHAWTPIPAADVPRLPGMDAVVADIYRYSAWVGHPAARLVEARAFQTGTPRALLQIAFDHAEDERNR